MRTLVLALVTLLAVPALAAGVGEKIPRFEAPVQDGGGGGGKAARVVDSHKTSRPTVYLFVGAKCPTTGMYIDRLRALEERHAGKVDFVFLYPNKTESASEKRAFHEKVKLAGAFVDDTDGKIAKLLGAQRTAEVFLVDGAKRLVYHGAIDDDRSGRKVEKSYLAQAIDEVRAGKPVTTPQTSVHA